MLASDSLELLLDALPTLHAHPLCSLSVWGSIMGMFELNNLAMEVLSPLRDTLQRQFSMMKNGHGLLDRLRCLQDAGVVTKILEALEDDDNDLCEVSTCSGVGRDVLS